MHSNAGNTICHYYPMPYINEYSKQSHFKVNLHLPRLYSLRPYISGKWRRMQNDISTICVNPAKYTHSPRSPSVLCNRMAPECQQGNCFGVAVFPNRFSRCPMITGSPFLLRIDSLLYLFPLQGEEDLGNAVVRCGYIRMDEMCTFLDV